MLKLSMLLGCIFMTNTTSPPENGGVSNDNNLLLNKREVAQQDFDDYSVTCYICVNVSDNIVCNQYAIDRPCRPGETFCHTLHIMDSKGTSVLVNKKCTTDKECQRTKVGCVQIDSQKVFIVFLIEEGYRMCVSCCDQNYCNIHAPTNASNAIFDDKITKMRMLAKNLFREREKALTTTIKQNAASRRRHLYCNLLLLSLYIFIRIV